MSAFAFVEAEKAEQHNVTKVCQLLEVSTSAFYDWHRHLPTARQLADQDECVKRDWPHCARLIWPHPMADEG